MVEVGGRAVAWGEDRLEGLLGVLDTGQVKVLSHWGRLARIVVHSLTRLLTGRWALLLGGLLHITVMCTKT